MIHVVDKTNKHMYLDELEQHFRIRYKIYVEERRWMALDRPDRREVDQFDTESATYLLAIENGAVVGGTRLCKTTEPHLMKDVFPFLPNVRGLQVGPNIVEWTRIFVAQSKRGTPLLNTILAGMFEYCLSEGYEAITVVMETWWMPRFLALGWDVEPLGIPLEYDGMEIVACLIQVTDQTYHQTRASAKLTSSVIVNRKSDGKTHPGGDVLPRIEASSCRVSLESSETILSTNWRDSGSLIRKNSTIS